MENPRTPAAVIGPANHRHRHARRFAPAVAVLAGRRNARTRAPVAEMRRPGGTVQQPTRSTRGRRSHRRVLDEAERATLEVASNVGAT